MHPPVLGIAWLTVLGFFGSPLIAHAQNDGYGQPFELALTSVENLTGDPIITTAFAESLFRRLLTLDAFASGERPSGGQGLDGGYFEVPNPFFVGQTSGTGSRRFTVRLELERTYYGPVLDVKNALVAYWAFGLLGIIARRGGSMGIVQWRAYIRDADSGAAFECIGQAAKLGDPEKLSRRTAITTANKRALYDLGYEIAELLSDAHGLGLRRKWLRDGEREFEARADGW